MTPVRYHPNVEQIQPDEAGTLDELSAIFRRIQENVLRNSGDAKRGTHSKATALVKGELVIADDLAPELAQGLFATGARYDALVRFAQGPSENLSDKASGQRGLSIKMLGVEGPHVAGSRETTTQDWVLATHDPAFTDGTAQQFLRTFRLTGAKATFLPQSAIIAGSRAARGAEAALEAVGPGSAHLRFFGKPPTHPASDSYFSQAPVRYGDHIAQVSPCRPQTRWRQSAIRVRIRATTTCSAIRWRRCSPGRAPRSTSVSSCARTFRRCRSRTRRCPGPRS